MVYSFIRCYFKEAEEDRKVSPYIHIHRVGSIKAYLTEKASIFITSYRTPFLDHSLETLLLRALKYWRSSL